MAVKRMAFDIKSDRLRHKVSQIKLAEITCTSQPTVARWEKEGTITKPARKLWEDWKAAQQETAA